MRIMLLDTERSSVTRWGKPIKTLAQKGTPGTPYRRISQRLDDRGQLRDWHPTKGFRVLAEARR